MKKLLCLILALSALLCLASCSSSESATDKIQANKQSEQLFEATDEDFACLERFLQNNRMDRDYDCKKDLDFDLNFDYLIDDLGDMTDLFSERTQLLCEALGMSKEEGDALIRESAGDWFLLDLYRERYLESECKWIIKNIYNSDNYEAFARLDERTSSYALISDIVVSLGLSDYEYDYEALYYTGFHDGIYNGPWENSNTPFIGYNAALISADRLPNGKYEIVYKLSYGTEESDEYYKGIGTALMGLKKCNGHRYWSVYSISFAERSG